MAVDISGDMVGLDVASAELDRLVAADNAQAADPAASGTKTDQSASDGQRAAQPESGDSKPSSAEGPKDQGTKGPKDPQTETQQQRTTKPDEQQQDNKSRYAKAQER